jgi:hypothetical protein
MGSLRMSAPSRRAATREILASRPSFETPARRSAIADLRINNADLG